MQLTQASETAVEQTQAMSEQLMEGANRLTGITENSTALIGEFAQSVRDQLKQLAHSSDQALAKLEGVSDMVLTRADRMTDAAKTAAEATTHADKAMKATLRSTSGAAEQTS